jgi:hypothetical protein
MTTEQAYYEIYYKNIGNRKHHIFMNLEGERVLEYYTDEDGDMSEWTVDDHINVLIFLQDYVSLTKCIYDIENNTFCVESKRIYKKISTYWFDNF